MEYAERPRSALLAQILQRMQQQSQFQPQSYGALAAGLGSAYLDKRSLGKEEKRIADADTAQKQALAKALQDFGMRSSGGPANIQLDNVGGGSQQLQHEYRPDPEGARQNLLGQTAQMDSPLAQGIAGQLVGQMLQQREPKIERVDVGNKILVLENGRPVGELPKGVTPDAAMNEQGQQNRFEGVSGSAQLNEAGENRRHATPSGSALLNAAATQDNERRKDIKTTQALRKEFRQLPSVRDYETALPIIKSAVNAPDTGPGDLQLIYSVGKLLDPNSVVREGELALTIASNSPLQRIIGATRFTAAGKGRLTPTARTQIMEMLNERVGAYEQAYDRDYQQYGQYAIEQSATPESVVGTHASTAFRGKKDTGPAAVKTDADFDKLPSGALFIAPDGSTRRKP